MQPEQPRQLLKPLPSSLASPFSGFVEILIGVNLLQTEVFLFNPGKKRRLCVLMAGTGSAPPGGWTASVGAYRTALGKPMGVRLF